MIGQKSAYNDVPPLVPALKYCWKVGSVNPHVVEEHVVLDLRSAEHVAGELSTQNRFPSPPASVLHFWRITPHLSVYRLGAGESGGTLRLRRWYHLPLCTASSRRCVRSVMFIEVDPAERTSSGKSRDSQCGRTEDSDEAAASKYSSSNGTPLTSPWLHPIAVWNHEFIELTQATLRPSPETVDVVMTPPSISGSIACST